MESIASSQDAAIDREMAIEMLSKGYDLMIQLQLHLTFPSDSWPNQFTQGLIEETQESILSALWILKGHHPGRGFQAAAPVSSCGNKGTGGDQKTRVMNRGPKKRRNSYSWTTVTESPHYDGYQWRKYGQKDISGSVFPRSYYRCTYDRVCRATKQVQQINVDDPPMFVARYFQQHTCEGTKKTPQIVKDSTHGYQQEVIGVDSYPGPMYTQQEQTSKIKYRPPMNWMSIVESSKPSNTPQVQTSKHKISSSSDHLMSIIGSSGSSQLEYAANASEYGVSLDYLMEFWLENKDMSFC